MSFCTAVNCMDGRIQLPVNRCLREHFAAEYVDTVTEAGPVGILSADPESPMSRSIYSRIDISVTAHLSTALAIVAHANCAGNPISDSDQQRQVENCVVHLRRRYPDLEIAGLWLDEQWTVHLFGAP